MTLTWDISGRISCYDKCIWRKCILLSDKLPQNSKRINIRRSKEGGGDPCSATSIVAAGFGGAAARCSFRLTYSGRFLLRRIAHWGVLRPLSAISMVATPRWGDCSLSIDLTSDEISATGGRQRFVLSSANDSSTEEVRSAIPYTSKSKTGTTKKVIPIFDVEHRGVEPLFRNLNGRSSTLWSLLPFG